MLRLHAPAKINLFLRVLAREASGYHQLETLFAGLAFGDELSVESTFSGISLETTGLSLGPVEDNLAYKAAKAFLDEAGLGTGVSIQLEKRTPLGGGLGGGSSDAAAVLKALNRLHPGRVTVARLLEMAGDLGSDVPFFLSPSSMALAWGRGDRFWPLSSLEPRPVVLVLSPFHVSTPDAFSQLAEARKREGFRGRPAVMDPAAFSQWDTVSAMGHNDFEDVVFERHPEAREVLEGLQSSGAILARLTGTGSALFGVYSDGDAAAATMRRLRADWPDLEFLSTQILSQERWADPWIQDGP